MYFLDNPSKPIYVFVGYANLYYDVNPNTGRIKSTDKTIADFSSNANYAISLKSIKDVNAKLHAYKHTGAIPDGSTLCFDKKSKFPRTKIAQIDTLSRCIKPAKADFIVINNDDIRPISSYYYQDKLLKVVEYDNCYVASEPDNTDICTRFKIANPTTHAIYHDAFEILETNKLVSKPIKIVSTGIKLTYFDNSWIDLFEKFNNEYAGKKYVTDNDLDKTVNKSLESLDIDAINTLDSMLESTDGDVVNMAMRLLGNYNISEYPLTFKTLLIFHGQKIFDAKSYSSNAFKQIMTTLGLDSLNRIPAFPMCLSHIPTTDKNGTKFVYTDADKQLYLKFTQSRRDVYLNGLKAEAQKVIDKYHLNVKPL